MYYIVYPILYAVSLLPWKVIYFLSDLFYVLIYYIIGYRKKVVRNNLLLAFPEKTAAERLRIEKDFYHQLMDTFIEMIKLISISEKELNKRFVCNYDLLHELYQTGQSVQLHGGHFFNWEFVNLAYGANTEYPFLGVYAPLSNKVFGRIIYNMRSRFKTILVPASDFKTKFRHYAKGIYALALAADQNPRRTQDAYWLNFMGKLTPFVPGPENGARHYNTAVVFATYYCVKRGYYASELKLYTTTPLDLPDGKITLDYRDFLEGEIRKRPANYLWSHRRWKWNYDPAVHSKNLLEQQAN